MISESVTIVRRKSLKILNDNRFYPTTKDAAYWTDLAHTLISEIVCSCGFVNKVENEWHSGFFRVECGRCAEGLDLHHILRAPNRAAEIIKALEDDSVEEDLFPFPVELKKELEKYARDLEKIKPTKNVEDIHDLVNFGEIQHDKSAQLEFTDLKSIQWDDKSGKYVRHAPKRNSKLKSPKYIEFTIEPPDVIMDSEAKDEKDGKDEKFGKW